MIRWGDEYVTLTPRGQTIALIVLALVILLAIVIAAANTVDPCAGKKGQDYQNCIDLNYP